VDNLIEEILKCAKEAAKLAGAILMVGFGTNFKISNKEGMNNIVTEYDIKSEKAIIDFIRDKFPEHGFLAEESGNDNLKSNTVNWIIDPLDGTTNFSIGNHFFNVSIALVYKKEIVLGVIFAPFFDQLFVAEKGKGVTLNNIKIKTSNKKKPIDSMMNFGYTYEDDGANKKMAYAHAQFLLKFEHAHNLGASELELAWVAMGRLEAYVLPHIKPWDIAAGILMISESGGKVTDFKNKEYKFTTSEKGTVIGSNGKIHSSLISILKTW